MGQMFGGDMGTMTAGDFSLIGYSGDNAMRDFLDGTSAITEGSVFEEGTENYDCIISQELATYNSLAVGDVMTLANPNDESETYDLNIVGIYETADTASENGMGGMFSAADPVNKIYMSYSALKSIVDQSTIINNNGMETSTAVFSQTNGTYVFANVNDYETFCEEVYDMGLSEDYTVTSADVNSYEQGLVPLDTLSTMAGYFLIVIVAIGVLILVVLNVFSIRERKYEIGVLTAIGMKKSKVAFIFITEILIVTIAAVIIGSGVGAAVSVPVGNALLENQITSQEQTAYNQQQAFGREMPSFDGTIAEPPQKAEGNGISAVTEISAAVDGEILVKLLGICVVLAIASAAVSVGTIMRYQPLNILANRD
ncbi:MAG TPA: ABC transporter permease [Firmicutes bacterium]|nr:ABC transporter permease [Bacillota bacterium]